MHKLTTGNKNYSPVGFDLATTAITCYNAGIAIINLADTMKGPKQDRLVELNKELSKIDRQIADVAEAEQDLDTLRAKRDILAAIIEERNTRIDTLTTELQGKTPKQQKNKRTQIAKHEAAVEKAATELGTVEGLIATRENEVSQLSTQSEVLQSDAEELPAHSTSIKERTDTATQGTEARRSLEPNVRISIQGLFNNPQDVGGGSNPAGSNPPNISGGNNPTNGNSTMKWILGVAAVLVLVAAGGAAIAMKCDVNIKDSVMDKLMLLVEKASSMVSRG